MLQLLSEELEDIANTPCRGLGVANRWTPDRCAAGASNVVAIAASMCMWVCVYVCVYVYMCMCICVHMCKMCVYVCVDACMCACVHV